MATKDRTSLKNDFANGKYATGEKFADLIDSMKVVQLPVVDPQALGTSLSFIDSISQDADGKITATKKTLDLANARELNPFKGWYKTGDTLPTDGFDGAYLYFKDTSELTGQTTIYRWNGTTYADTGTVVDTSNVNTFATGQAVNETSITDRPSSNSDELITSGAVFAELYDDGEVVDPSSLPLNPNHLIITTTGKWIVAAAPDTDTVSYALIAGSQGNYIIIKKGLTAAGIAYAFLKTSNPASGVSADFATGYDHVITNTTDSELKLLVPEDANYLYFVPIFNGVSYMPAEIRYIEEKYVRVSELSERIEDSAPFVDMNLDNVILNSYNDIISHSVGEKWVHVSTDCQTVMMPCSGCKSAKIEVDETSNTIAYAFLKSKEYEIGDVADYASGYSQVITVYQDVEVIVPSDAEYLYLVYVYAGDDIKPAHVYLKGTYATKQEVANQLYELQNAGAKKKRGLGDLLKRNFNVISHLGGGSFYGNVAPMNSMWSANLGARMGLRCCEFDIVFTSDDVPICCHDLNISTSGNNEFVRKDGTPITGSTPIGSLTYQQIIDTYEYRQGFVGYKQVSTLYDVLTIYRDNNIIPCLEIKDPATSMTPERYSLVLKALYDYVGEDFMIGMFDVDNAIAFRNLDENAIIGIAATSLNSSMITTAKKYNFFAGIYIGNVTSQIVQQFKDEGVDFYAWTVSTDVNAALKLGIRYFICDYIAETQNNAGVVDTYVSNAVDFSNITNTGTVSGNHLLLAAGESAAITSNVTHWLNSVEVRLVIKGTCTINVRGTTSNTTGNTSYTVDYSDFGEYVILLRQYNQSSVTVTINGVCEVASLTAVFKSY